MKGIVLAGGQSSRFGENKALARLGGRSSLLEVAACLLSRLQLKPTIIASREQDYSRVGYEVIRDLIPHQGPLGGLYTACHFFKGESLMVLTCDMPALTVDCLRRLLKHHKKEFGATIFSYGCKPQPFPGIYESSLIDLVFKRIRQNQLSMVEFLRELPHTEGISWHRQPDLLININRKEDLAGLFGHGLKGE